VVVVLEDAPMGVTSAEAAGCRVIAVPDHAVIEPTARRFVVPSLEAVDLELLSRLIAVQ
jgi:beta-phosphoglucomutase-like phosphatase (HAD superfamily)